MEKRPGIETRDQLRLAARALGEALAQVGDFYDLTEEIAIGYANGHMGTDWPPPSPAYTTGPQTGQPPAASSEPNSPLDQEKRRRLRERHLLLQVSALNSLKASADSVMTWRVDDARDVLASWQDIGDALDISKQGAQQRFGPAARGYKEISGDIKEN
jgi:hypothetical protein